MRLSVIIPTLNAAHCIEKLVQALLNQKVVPDEILIVDSQSEDGTACMTAALPKVKLVQIRRSEFDHGGTRDMALRISSGEIVVFMTQDALPTNEHFLDRLIAPLEDPCVATVGGRQVAYPDARPFEQLVRSFNYPEEDRVWCGKDIQQLGVKAFLISDVCAAYRRAAYLAVGGFDHPILTNEDMLMAERLLHAGYKLAYAGKAEVYHSHRFTLRQEYRRNLLIGRTMKRYEARFEHVQEMGTGMALAKNVLFTLFRERHVWECSCFCANCTARMLGNRVGRILEMRQRKLE